MQESHFWQIIAIAAAGILGFAGRKWVTIIISQLKEVRDILERIAVTNERQNGEIKMLDKTVNMHERRLDDHSRRIEKMERKNK